MTIPCNEVHLVLGKLLCGTLETDTGKSLARLRVPPGDGAQSHPGTMRGPGRGRAESSSSQELNSYRAP